MAGQELWSQLRTQYADSLVMQYLLPLIPAILLVYLAVVAAEQIEPLQTEYHQLQQQQSRIATLQTAADWSALVARAQQQERLLGERIWHAESVDLGTADVQGAIAQISKTTLEASRVKFAAPLWLPEAGAWQLSAELTGRVAAGQAQSLMLALSRQRPQLVVDRFSYSILRNGYSTIQVAALLEAPAPDKDAEAKR